MTAETWTVTEVLLASLSIVLLIGMVTIGILLSRLTYEISKSASKLHSLLTSMDARIREISEAIISLKVDLSARKDKEDQPSKTKRRDTW